jgi:phosphoesterase RecJ-like protein
MMSEPRIIDENAAIRRIHDAKRIVVTTHARADGDAIGSAAAMQRVLRQMGKQARAYLHEPPTARYSFLCDDESPAIWKTDETAAVLKEADLLIIVDTCARVQLGEIADAISAMAGHRLAIDHHLTRDDIVSEVHIDDKAAACAQIVASMCDLAGWKIDSVCATLLFVGLATDTGWFRFSNTDASALKAAARLIEAGARPNELYEKLYLCETLPRARLIGEVMSSFELLADGRLAVIQLTREALARCGATHQMTEDLINEPQKMGTVMACIQLVEPPDDGPIRVSLRSKREIDVAQIAKQFGGGGHARAAGVRIAGKLPEVTLLVTNAMLSAMPAK